jgi:hypothetical protein
MRLLSNFKTLALLTVAVAGIASRSDAAIVTVPAGLNPGDLYRLVFVTSTGRDATSSDIADYNAFVATVANSIPELAALGASWFAIASTSAVDARDNIDASPPSSTGIYRLDGALVFAGTGTGPGGMWSGAVPYPPILDELGVGGTTGRQIWSGTLGDGTGGATGFELGSPRVMVGYDTDTAGPFPGWWCCAFATEQGALYAISSELTVLAEVPEPGTIGLTALGGAILLFAMRRKQRNRLAARTDRTTPAHH